MEIPVLALLIVMVPATSPDTAEYVLSAPQGCSGLAQFLCQLPGALVRRL